MASINTHLTNLAANPDIFATCGREIFEFGEKKLRIEKYPHTCRQGLSLLRDLNIHLHQNSVTFEK